MIHQQYDVYYRARNTRGNLPNGSSVALRLPVCYLRFIFNAQEKYFEYGGCSCGALVSEQATAAASIQRKYILPYLLHVCGDTTVLLIQILHR